MFHLTLLTRCPQFTGQSQYGEQIYMSVSNNNNPGSWTQLNGGNLVLQSNVGTKGVRDPSLIRSQDGKKFWIIATVRSTAL